MALADLFGHLIQVFFFGIWAHPHGFTVYLVFLALAGWSAWGFAKRSDAAVRLGAISVAERNGILFGAVVVAVLLATAQVLPLVIESAGTLAALRRMVTSGALPLGMVIGATTFAWVMMNDNARRGAWLDALTLPLLAWLGVAALGAYLAGLEVFHVGRATHLPWGVNFGDGVYRHPVPLYEMLGLFAISRLTRYLSAAELRLAPGDVFRLTWMSVLALTVMRGFLKPPFQRPRLLTEVLRGEPLAYFGVLTAVQAVALMLLLFMLPAWWRMLRGQWRNG